MASWRQAGRKALVSGAVASVLSTIALAACGRIERRSAAGPINGPSQWVYGRGAAYRRAPTLRHTLVGYLVHHVTATGWALLHERMFGASQPRSAASQLAGAATTAALANFVDFNLTPRRLRPGFEVQLSRKSLLVVYAAFALGLAAAEIAATRQKTRH